MSSGPRFWSSLMENRGPGRGSSWTMNLSLGHLFCVLLALELTLGPHQPPLLEPEPQWRTWESGDRHSPSPALGGGREGPDFQLTPARPGSSSVPGRLYTPTRSAADAPRGCEAWPRPLPDVATSGTGGVESQGLGTARCGGGEDRNLGLGGKNEVAKGAF